MRVLAVVLFAVLFVLSCADPKKASNGNFKKAIQTTLDRDPAFIITSLPMEYPDFRGKHYIDEPLEVLVTAGIVKKTVRMVHDTGMSAVMSGRNPKDLVPGIRYELTENGKKYHRTIKRMMGPVSVLAYGNKEVLDVVRYTEPSAAFGQTLSEVTYTYRLVNVPDWAKNAAVEKAFSTNRNGQLESNATPIEAKQSLVLMSDGWRNPELR